METQIQSTMPASICEGCLSVDRKLSPLVKDESQKFFDEILDPLDNIELPLMLCWECLALTNRFVKFKHQIKNAHSLLVKYKTRQITKLPTLTSLCTKTNLNTIFIDSQFHRTQNEESLIYFNDDKTSSICDVNNTLFNINTENNFYNNNKININNVYNENQPVTETDEEFYNKTDTKQYFDNTHKGNIELNQSSEHSRNLTHPMDRNVLHCRVEDWQTNTIKPDTNNDIRKEKFSNNGVRRKVEKNEEYCVKTEVDRFDINDDLFNMEIEIDGEEIDADIKQVFITQEIKNENSNKTKIKKKRKKRQTLDDFDESDDEPLTFKKQKEEVDGVERVRGRRKQKEGDDQKPKGRREKPPGVVYNARVERKLRELNVSPGTLEMVVLSWEQVEEERERAIGSEAFLRHEYKCMDCVVGFNHRAKLENHMKKHDPSSGEMVCDVCKVRCRDRHSLGAHKRRHRVRWRCCICQSMSSRASVSADHVARVHPQYGGAAHTHTCAVCRHTEPTLGKLKHHMKSHSERQKCDVCGKTFIDKTSLRTHLFIHKGEKEYACPQCDKKFLFKKAMEVHMVTHNDSEHLYCYECDMTFKNRMSYYQHMKYNLKHIDPAKLKYACELCDKKFAKAARLQEHNVAVHLKVTPIHCTMEGCSFSCSSRPVLRTHMRMIHRNMRARRNHVCHHCGKAYTTKKTLECHLRSHTGVRPLRCTECAARFSHHAALYTHRKLRHCDTVINKEIQ